MKNILQNSVLPFALFAGALALFGCDQSSNPMSESVNAEPETRTQVQTADESVSSTQNSATLKSGNMFYIVRDVADVQSQAGEYLEKIQQLQTDVQTAVDHKDTAQLQTTVTNLKTELTEFNDILNKLNLKSQEIDQIRQKIIQSNQQVLSSSLMNGDIDLSKVDVKKIEQQMGNIQSEMIKLGGLLLENGAKSSTDTSEDRPDA
ncbi:hypothetical protein A3K93_11875 [Acinetobacter sp. NCu2D-2]|uniref:hypothetical protein n=1 Tax=Acinetobacter sp. NCu2D-2 TaxID=1608473 RepID=UPI0007CDB452|nr:hypothetical protein [Acinetobacter sp. NCu2D-2]ANF82813.1 hypothetical protein A3K93_11875 [Acinetobacter sp. NCu2D-2]